MTQILHIFRSGGRKEVLRELHKNHRATVMFTAMECDSARQGIDEVDVAQYCEQDENGEVRF